jgi:hypothetical protein
MQKNCIPESRWLCMRNKPQSERAPPLGALPPFSDCLISSTSILMTSARGSAKLSRVRTWTSSILGVGHLSDTFKSLKRNLFGGTPFGVPLLRDGDSCLSFAISSPLPPKWGSLESTRPGRGAFEGHHMYICCPCVCFSPRFSWGP